MTIKEGIGHCPHGEFDTSKGCPQCMAGHQASKKPIIKDTESNKVIAAAIPIKEPKIFTLPENDGALTHGEVALALRPGEDVEVRNYSKQAVKLLEEAELRNIVNFEDMTLATDSLSAIAKLKKAMEAKRKEYISPLRAQIEAIQETYDYLMAPIKQADGLTREKMLAFNKEQERIRHEQEEINRKRQEAAEAELKLKGKVTEPINLVEVVPPAPTSTKTDMGIAGQTDHWKYEVIDPLLVPREYLVIDNAQLTAIAKRHHDKKPIPGIRFYNEPIMRVRAR